MNRKYLMLAAFGGALFVTTLAQAGEDTTITVYKSPWCGCCEVWTDAMAAAGYKVVIEDMEDLAPIKKQAGIPDDLQACHTAVTGGAHKYIIEGHVPLEAVEKMMTERPDIRGIAVPGMPQGSLGMGHDPDAQYTVFALGRGTDDQPHPYMKMGQ
jgi:hypothetical protein